MQTMLFLSTICMPSTDHLLYEYHLSKKFFIFLRGSHGRYANISTTTISTITYLGTGRWLLFFPSSRPIPISTTTYLGTGRWFLFFLDPPFFFSSRSRFVHTYYFLQRGSHHFAVLYLDILDYRISKFFLL